MGRAATLTVPLRLAAVLLQVRLVLPKIGVVNVMIRLVEGCAIARERLVFLLQLIGASLQTTMRSTVLLVHVATIRDAC